MVRYLVTSGNSNVGFEVIRSLAALGEKDIVAGARDVEKSKKELIEAGAREVVHLDLYKTETIEKALAGVDRALLVAGSPSGGGIEDIVLWAQNFAKAAKASHVKLVARISGGTADPNGQGAARLQGLADLELRNSGIDWVTFGPNFFFSNFLQAKASIKYGEHIGASGEGRTAYIAVEDIADVTAAVLTHPEKHGTKKHIVLTGGAAVTDGEIIKSISDAINKPVKFTSVAPEAYTAKLIGYGMSKGLADFLTTLEVVRLNSWSAGTTQEVEKILGRKPMTHQEWAKKHRDDFN